MSNNNGGGIFSLKPKRSSNEFLHDAIELMRQQLDKADEEVTKLMVTVFRGGFRMGVYQAKRELLLEMNEEGKEYITKEEIERQFEPEFEKWAEEWYRKAVGFDE